MHTIDMYQVVNSPVVTVAIGVVLTACVAVASAVIGLFLKVSSLSATVTAMAENLRKMTEDKDVMRWSQWGPAHSQRQHTAGDDGNEV